MSNNNAILVISPDTEIRDRLQESFPDTLIQNALNIETINQVVKTSENLAAVLLYLSNSDQWIHMEFLQSCYPNVPKFAIVGYRDSSFDDRDPINTAMQHGASYVFSHPADMVRVARRLANTIPVLSPPVFNIKDVRGETLSDILVEIERLIAENDEDSSKVPVPDTDPSFEDVDILNKLHTALLNMQFR